MRLYIVRHGETDWNVQRRLQGESDVPLNHEGKAMAVKTGEALEQATPYIRALSRLWGLGELTVIAEENMDYSTPEEIEAKIKDGIGRGIEIARNF